MQVKCIRAHGLSVPGDVVDVPDGASVDPYHFEAIVPGGEHEPPAGDGIAANGGQPIVSPALQVQPVPKGM